MDVFRAITDRIFGFDVFVSYSRTDGVAYARKLEEELRRAGFRCFLDSKEMPPGETLQSSLRNALKRSSSLVLVASPGAVQHSRYMPQEFDYYTSARKRQKIVPISIGRALDDAPADLPLCQRVRGRADVIWISEQSDQLPNGPSGETLKSLTDSFRFTRRNTIRNRIVFAVTIVLAVLLVLAVWMGIRAERQRQIAVSERNRAQRTLSEVDYRQAARASENDRDEDALAFLARAIESDPTNEMATSRLLSLLLYRNWPAEQFVLEHGAPLVSGGFSADGRLILTAGKDGSVKLWDASDGKLLHTFSHGGPMLKAAFSPGGSQIVTAGGKSIRIWDSRSGKQLGSDLVHDFPVTDFAFEPAGKLLATACAGPTPAVKESEEGEGELRPAPGYAQLWDLATSRASGAKLREGRGATHLAWHAKEPWLALGIEDNVQLWDVRANKPRFDLWELTGMFFPRLSALRFDPAGKRLIAAGASYSDGVVAEAGVDVVGGVRMWDTASGKSLFPVENVDTTPMEPYHESWVRDATVVGNEEEEGICILTATDAGEVAGWWKVSEEGEERLRFETSRNQTAFHEIPVERLITQGSASLMTIANNQYTGFGYARRWRMSRRGMFAASERMEHAGLVTGAGWSPDGARALTIGDDGFARVWWTAPTEAMEERTSRTTASDVAPAPSTNEERDEPPRRDPVVERLAELRSVTTQDLQAHEITLVAGPSLDGAEFPQPLADELAKVATARDANRTRFFVLIGPEPFRAFRSPDGRWVVTSKCGEERGAAEATLWDLTARGRAGGLSTELPIMDVAFASDAACFAVASGYNRIGSVRIFTTLGAQPLAPAFSGPGKPLQLSFAPGASRLAVGFADPMNGSTVGVFDVQKGLALIEARFTSPDANAMHFFPDGQRFVVAKTSEDLLYDVPTLVSPVPHWLPELARVVARRELDSASAVQRIRAVAPRLEALRMKVHSSPDSPAKSVALMVLTQPGERHVSPFARQTRRERREDDIREWKRRVGEAMGGSEGYAETTMLSLLEEAREIEHHTFGDATLLALIEPVTAELRKKTLELLSAGVAKIEKDRNLDEVSSVSRLLHQLHDLGIADLPFALQIKTVQERLAKAGQKSATPAPKKK